MAHIVSGGDQSAEIVKNFKQNPKLARAVFEDPGFRAAITKLAALGPALERDDLSKGAHNVFGKAIEAHCKEIMASVRAHTRAQGELQKVLNQPMPGGPALRAMPRRQPVRGSDAEALTAKAMATDDQALREGYLQMARRAEESN